MSMTVTKSLALSGTAEGGLICVKGDYIGKMIPMPSDTAVILGRDPSQCTYVMSDDQVSRKHCEITYVGATDQYRIIDRSKNGTFFSKDTDAPKEQMEKDKEYYFAPGTTMFLGNKNNIYRLR